MSGSESKRRTTYIQGWSLYPFSALGHHLQGTAAALAILCGITPVMVVAVIWTLLYVAYQGLSVLRKADSPGLDIADYLAGFAFGCTGYAAYYYYWTQGILNV